MDEVKAYSKMILTRMRNLKPLVKYIFTSMTNLHNEVRTSIIKLQKVRKRDIKILIINYSDFDRTMSYQLRLQFTQ